MFTKTRKLRKIFSLRRHFKGPVTRRFFQRKKIRQRKLRKEPRKGESPKRKRENKSKKSVARGDVKYTN